jgi:hypothetical protein
MKNVDKKTMKMSGKGSAGGFFLLTYIGAAVHFVSQVDGFWNIILALLKAVVWPAYLVNRVFDLLHI